MAAQHLVDAFVHGFRERALVMRAPTRELIEEAGMVALLGTSAEAMDGRVLVTDDRPIDTLRGLLPELNARVVNVLATAPKCHELVSGTGDYRLEPATAMVCEDLANIPALPLVDGLELRPVSAAPGEADSVSLEEAAAAGIRADPGAAPVEELDGFVEYLRAAPNASYLAAVDHEGVVRATASSSVFGPVAGVFFVNTDPAWRGRGVGAAMTAAALRGSVAAGATRAFLDASDLGLSMYLRLGFQPICGNTLFVRKD